MNTFGFDANKGITKIEYDLLGNPKKISFADRSYIDYVYTADGRRLKTRHYVAVPSSTTLSLGQESNLTSSQIQSKDSTDYIGSFVFENNAFKQYHFEGGYITGSGSVNNYKYYVKDHLGNNRILASYNGIVEQTNHYYPFGSTHHFSSNQGVQKYKYNGKELDTMHGLNMYDYGARQYDPAIGQFSTMDPLCEMYYHISPYTYCGGNPVNMVDPDGMNPIYDTQGNFLGTDDLGLQGYYYIMDKDDFIQGMSHLKVGDYAVMGSISKEIENKIEGHYNNLPKRPDYDGFVTIAEGIDWAKSHPYALKNPSPDNTLYIDASKLDFGSLSISDFPKTGNVTPQNLFTNSNLIESAINADLMATVYALGRVDMVLTNRSQGTVRIVNSSATDYDWNVGGGTKRDAFIRANNFLFDINPNKHGFKTYYYGIGTLRK